MKSEVTCGNCGVTVPNKKFCISCGKPLFEVTPSQEPESTPGQEQEATKETTETVEPSESTIICPLCRKANPSSHSFCAFCGGNLKPRTAKVASTAEIPPKVDSKDVILKEPFQGFEVPLLFLSADWISSFRAYLSEGASAFPQKPAESPTHSSMVSSSYFSVPSARKTSRRLIQLEVFGGENFKHFLGALLFTVVIYMFWFAVKNQEVIRSLESDYNAIIEVSLLALTASLFLVFLLLFPILLASTQLHRKVEISLDYRLNPIRMAFLALFNLLAPYLSLQFPMIFQPGELTPLREVIPPEDLKKDLAQGTFAVIIIIFVFSAVSSLFLGASIFTFEPLFVIPEKFQKHLLLTVLSAIWIGLITIFPFGDMFGRFLYEEDQRLFFVCVVLQIITLAYASILLSPVA